MLEDVASLIPVTGVDDTVGMSAYVESSREPHVEPCSPVVTSTVDVGDRSYDRALF